MIPQCSSCMSSRLVAGGQLAEVFIPSDDHDGACAAGQVSLTQLKETQSI